MKETLSQEILITNSQFQILKLVSKLFAPRKWNSASKEGWYAERCKGKVMVEGTPGGGERPHASYYYVTNCSSLDTLRQTSVHLTTYFPICMKS